MESRVDALTHALPLVQRDVAFACCVVEGAVCLHAALSAAQRDVTDVLTRALSSQPSHYATHSEQYVTMDSAFCRRYVGVLLSVSRTKSKSAGNGLGRGLGNVGLKRRAW